MSGKRYIGMDPGVHRQTITSPGRTPRGKGAAVSDRRYHTEMATRQQVPGWLKNALGYARGNAYPDRLGVLVLHETGAIYDMVVLSRSDFEIWFGLLPEQAPDRRTRAAMQAKLTGRNNIPEGGSNEPNTA